MKQALHFVFRFISLLFFVSVFVYLLTALLPGTAQELLAGLESNTIQNKENSNGLFKDFFIWIWKIIQLDFAVSYFSGESVLRIVARYWFPTLFLGSISWVIALVLAINIVTVLFNSQKKHIHKGYLIFELLILSFTPVTIGLFAVLLISIFALPIPIFYNSTSGFFHLLRYLPPLCVLILLQIPVYVRSLQASIRQTQKRPYILFARSLGFTRRQLWCYEILPNSLLYTVSLSSVQLSLLLGGSVLIEYTFSIPGLGTALVQAVRSRDLELVRCIVLFYGVIVSCLHSYLAFLHKKYFGLERSIV